MNVLKNTTKEQERERRDKQLAIDFRALKKAYPNASTERIARTIEATGKYHLTVPGIKRVLYRTGTITPKARA